MQIEQVKVGDLQPHPKNPRIHPDSLIEKLVKSIERFGWASPILATKEYEILAGHARWKAAREAGRETVPVVVLPLEGKQAEAYLLADNKVQEGGYWDTGKLNDVLLRLIKADMESLIAAGYEDAEINRLLAEETTEEFIPREHVEAIREFEREYGEMVAAPRQEREQREKPAPKGDTNWFYIEYYGQDDKFLRLVEALEEMGALVDDNHVGADAFEQIVIGGMKGR